MTEDILRDVPDAVLRHTGKHRIPQLSAAQRSGPSHAVAGEGAEDYAGDHGLKMRCR